MEFEVNYKLIYPNKTVTKWKPISQVLDKTHAKRIFLPWIKGEKLSAKVEILLIFEK